MTSSIINDIIFYKILKFLYLTTPKRGRVLKITLHFPASNQHEMSTSNNNNSFEKMIDDIIGEQRESAAIDMEILGDWAVEDIEETFGVARNIGLNNVQMLKSMAVMKLIDKPKTPSVEDKKLIASLPDNLLNCTGDEARAMLETYNVRARLQEAHDLINAQIKACTAYKACMRKLESDLKKAFKKRNKKRFPKTVGQIQAAFTHSNPSPDVLRNVLKQIVATHTAESAAPKDVSSV